MALIKPVRWENGITTSYHRILYLSVTTNRQNSIAVASYVDEQSRLSEDENPMNGPYKECVTYETDYDETMTIESAYEYLKTLPVFENAIDA